MNDKWSIPVEAADMLHMQAMWDWLYDYQDSHPLSIPILLVMVNAVVKGGPFTWEPYIILRLKIQGMVGEAL